MLRLRPTVVRLTAAEVADVVTRRRFRRYLELDQAHIAPYGLSERDKPGGKPLLAVSSPEALERESTPQTDSGKRAASPPNSWALPSAEDSPVPDVLDRSVEQDIPSSPDPTPRRGQQKQAGEDGRQHTPGSLRLPLRPKHDLTTIADGDGAGDLDEPAVQLNSLATSSTSTPRRSSPESSGRMEQRGAAAPGPASTTSLAGSHTPRSTEQPGSQSSPTRRVSVMNANP